ncbi:MAG: crosslink repair DNA glycosylase YcaQ family protein [Anaerolineae bacterium]
MRLTLPAARHLMLAAMGLDRRPARPALKDDVLAAIRRMEVLQIDTIHVVARSPYLVLWSRLGDYPQHWLDELLAEGRLFEYWSHEASFLPIEDFPLYRLAMLDGDSRRTAWSRDWIANHHAAVHALLHGIRANGPVRSADFERTDGRKGTWWDRKFEKQALEHLFDVGELMIARRQNFQRVYDLRQRVLPDWDDARLPTREVRDRALVLRAVRALGVTQAGWVADYFRTPKIATAQLTRRLADEGELLTAEVAGWSVPGYIHPDNLAIAETAAAGALTPELTTLLSPFDPLVWDRARAKAMFDFEYRIECYTPAPKRRYGYFSLPILRRGALIGRLDPKAHRREGRFEVKALHLEPGVPVTDDLVTDLRHALREIANWHGTPRIEVVMSDPPELAAALSEAV